MDAPPVVIWGEEMEALLHYRDLVPRLEEALGHFSRRDTAAVLQPVRMAVPLRKYNGTFFVMPAYMENDDVLSTKFVSFYRRETHSALPSVSATVMLFDPQDGKVKAIMDGEVITSMRTAAASAISAKFLMRPGAEVLAILGTGKQARSHYDIFTEMFPFKEVRVFGKDKERRESFARSLGGAARACDSAEEAASGADVIVTASRTSDPLLFGQWVKPGAHVVAVGSCRPDMRELDDRLMKEAVVYVDSRESAMVESGDVILSGAEVFAELGDLINGTKPAHRDRTTVFKSLGLALEDAVSAKLVFEQWNGRTGQA